ncbi:MAG: polyribonucleotide nucleotidyltransferase, partial [Clostridia bacterium]|nr:polyribonucleotide nucleotidyltransferase [Clostridia bacterium]
MFAGKELIVETGKHAQLANGSCLLKYGDTTVLCTATAGSEPREGIDYFPLIIDYEERMYSVGKIPGGYKKREGKSSDAAVLTSRVIDRPMRPLFPDDIRNEVAIICTVMSVEQDFQPEIVAMIGASLAVTISDIPFGGPIAGVAIGLVDGKVVLNPNVEEREASDMYVTLAGTKDKICMIEAGANEVPDDVLFNALLDGHKEIQSMCDFIIDIQKQIGKPKFAYQSNDVPKEVYEEIEAFAIEDMKKGVLEDDKTKRDENLMALKAKVKEAFGEKYKETPSVLGDCIYKLEKKVVRNYIFNEAKRVDGRSLDQIRELYSEVGVLPRTHGSGLFQRGQTQVLSVVTLSSMSDVQRLDGLDETATENRYMHHYNFPGYSVG